MVKQTNFLELLADHGKRFIDSVRVTGNGDNALRTRTIRNVDLGRTLVANELNVVPTLADNTADLLNDVRVTRLSDA